MPRCRSQQLSTGAHQTFRPHIAVLLNLFPDHLDRHETMEAYGATKLHIYANQEPTDTAIIDRDNPAAWAMRSHTQDPRLLPFSILQPEPEGADLAEGWLRVVGERVCPADALRAFTAHTNLGNALAAPRRRQSRRR